MDCCRHGSPHEHRHLRGLVRLFFKSLVFIGCFSVGTQSMAIELPAHGGYFATVCSYGCSGAGPYNTVQEAITDAVRITPEPCYPLGGSEAATACYGPTWIDESNSGPWVADSSVNFTGSTGWHWRRSVRVLSEMRYFSPGTPLDSPDYGTQINWYSGEVRLSYQCPIYNGSYLRISDDPALWGPDQARLPQMPTCTDGVPDCPVTALTPIPANDTCANTLERYNATQAEREAACGTLTSAMQTAVGCFRDKLAPLQIPLVITGEIRNIEYQRHLREIWDKMERLVALTEDNPTLATACATRRNELAAEKGCNHAGGCRPRPSNNECRITGGRNHCLVSPPAPPDPNAATHTQGRAIDVDETQTVNALEDALAARTPPQTIQGFLDAPTNCGLDWLGNADRVHFQLR